MKTYHIIAKNENKRVEYRLNSLNKLMLRGDMKKINNKIFGLDTTVKTRIKETAKTV